VEKKALLHHLVQDLHQPPLRHSPVVWIQSFQPLVDVTGVTASARERFLDTASDASWWKKFE